MHPYSPGYQPDLGIDGAGRNGQWLALDLKIGNPLKASTPPAHAAAAAHTPFMGTADGFLVKMFGRRQIGSPGDPLYSITTGTGYLSPKAGDYAGALRLGTEVQPLIHEVQGGFHPAAVSFINRCCEQHKQRVGPGPHAASAFRAYHCRRISFGIAKGLAFDIARGRAAAAGVA